MTSRALTQSAWLALSILGLSACQGTPTPIAPAAEPLMLPQGRSGVAPNEFIPAVFHLSLDTSTMTAAITPVRHGAAQPPQNLSFDFDIDQFINPTTLTLNSVSQNLDGDIRVDFVHRHPFSYPHPELPPTGANRADLGYTGRLLLLTGGIPEFFFGSNVRANPRVIRHPDGYINPGDLLPNGPAIPIVNTYPYMLLVDDQKDNRPGISNDGDVRGSYTNGTDGWQASNFGSDNARWTGYDYLHGGQSCSNNFVISQSAITGGAFDLDLAVLIKYTDPRGAGGPTYRLPPDPADVSKFAYRLPYAALDLSLIDFDEGLVIGNDPSAMLPITLRVRDWDMNAMEAPTFNLGTQSDVTLVQAGASGQAQARISAPRLFNVEQTISLLGGSGSGLPGDEAEYLVTVPNQLLPVQGSTVWAAAEFVDPEDDDPDAVLYRYGVDPVTIAGSPARALKRVTYQLIPILIEPDPAPPALPKIISVTPANYVGTSFDTITFQATVEGLVGTYYWSFPQGGVEDITGLKPTFEPELTVRLSRPGVYTGYLVASNTDGDSAAFPFVFGINSAGSFTATRLTIDGTINAHELSVAQSGVRAQVAVIDDTAHALYHYRSTRNIPDNASQWVKIQLDATTALDQPQLVLYNDRPVILYKRTNGKTRIAISNIPDPTAPSDWVFYSFPDTVDRHSEVVVTGNRLMFAYRNSATGILEVARANVAEPGASDWIYYGPDGDIPESGQPRMFANEGLTTIFAHSAMDNSLGWISTYQASPRLSTEWFRYKILADGTTNQVTDFFFQEGLPHVILWESSLGHLTDFKGRGGYPNNPMDWDQVPIFNYSYNYYFGAARRVGSRMVITTKSIFDFLSPFSYIALTDHPANSSDYVSYDFADLGGDYGSVPIRTLTPTGDPQLMIIYANGTNGLMQSVADHIWN